MGAPGERLEADARTAGAEGISARIARFAADADATAMPASARAIAKLSLLDWSAVALAGTGEPVSRIVRQMVLQEAGTPESSLVGHAPRVPARAAALANGTASHALDYDDTHFDYIGHPSVAIAPAALALAERVGASGDELLAAFLVGVETACRVGRYLGRAHYQHGFHQTSTSGAFGAAAACARLMRLDATRTRHALGIAATRASGLKSQFGTMGKPFHAGMAAANGVEAATLASLGFVSRPDALECAQGFADTHAGAREDPEAVLDGLGTVFRFERVQYKHHACCHGTHAALEALVALRGERSLRAEDIADVAVRVHPRWLRVCDIQHPATGLEAKFSYRLTTAMALAGRDTAALATFTDEACSDPALVRLRDLVRVETDEALADTESIVRVELRSGERLERRHDLDEAMPVERRQAKLLDKARGLLGRQRADALWSVVGALESHSARDLAETLRAP